MLRKYDPLCMITAFAGLIVAWLPVILRAAGDDSAGMAIFVVGGASFYLGRRLQQPSPPIGAPLG